MSHDLWEVEWDESATRLYRLAHQESFAIGDEYIGTQHLLLAAASVTPTQEHGFEALCRDRVLSAILKVLGVRRADDILISPGGQTPRAKIALEKAMRRALVESRRVNCRDVWHGLLAEESESDCWLVLSHLGIPIVRLREVLT